MTKQAKHIQQLIGQVDMLKAQNFELKRLLDAAPRCDHCARTELLRRSIETNVIPPLLRQEIRAELNGKETR